MAWDWDPFEHFRRMHEQIERAFHEPHAFTEHFVRPAIANVYETETGVIAEFELPGVDKKDINISITAKDAEVSVARKEEKEERKKKFYRKEARTLSFYRKITFPAEIIPEKAKATYRNGILRVEAPKAKPSKKQKHYLKVE